MRLCKHKTIFMKKMLIVLFLMLVSCSPLRSSEIIPTSNILYTPTEKTTTVTPDVSKPLKYIPNNPTPNSTSTLTKATKTPKLTLSPKNKTSLPEIQTDTLTPIPILTSTEIPILEPTLSSAEAVNYFNTLLQYDSLCLLPCLLRITPGVSTWEETRLLFDHLGVDTWINQEQNGMTFYGTSGIFNHGVKNNFDFVSKNGKIESVYVNAVAYYIDGGLSTNEFQSLWKDFAPEKINRIYGVPDRIFVIINGPYETGDYAYGLTVLYDRFDFMIIYQGKVLITLEGSTQVYKICPTWQDMVWWPELKIYVKSKENRLSLEDYFDFALSSEHTFNQAFGLDSIDYYNRLLPGNGPACFSTYEK